MFTEYLTALEARANQAIKTEEGDYIKDGLLYCGKCHTPKQCKVEAFDKTFFPKCLCQCEIEREAKEKEEAERRDLMERIKRYRKMGFPESQMQYWTFANSLIDLKLLYIRLLNPLRLYRFRRKR